MSDEPTERERLCICPPFHPAGMPDDTHTRECSRHWVLLAERIAQARREGAAEALESARDDAHAMGAPKTVRDFLTARAAAPRGDA